MQHAGALVVEQRTEHAALTLDVTEAITEIDRPLVGIFERPLAELAQDVAERAFTAPLLRIQRRQVLREAFAQPLLVIVLPADRLPEPLMRELVRHEELGEALERGRIIAP